MLTPPGEHTKYRPLYDCLVHRREAGETSIWLSFCDINGLLRAYGRGPLPSSAWSYAAWWDLHHGSQSKAWGAAGWKATPNFLSQAVLFTAVSFIIRREE